MANTTNFGWETPDDTDLVKDGAAAMRTLGNSIDASFVDLKGGTTGQILSKNSNTDLDYIWINNDQGDITAVTAGTGISGGGTSGAVTITNSMATEITASGDIIVGTGSGTFDNLPIGTTGQVLTADTTVSPYKVKWATISSGGWTLDSTTTLSGSSTSITLPSGYRMLVIICTNYQSNGTNYPSITLNSDGSTSYRWTGIAINGNAQNTSYYGTDSSYINLSNGGSMNTGANSNQFVFEIFNQDSTTAHKNWRMTDMGLSDASTLRASWATGFYRSNNAVTSIQIKAGSSTWSAGSVLVYGVK